MRQQNSTKGGIKPYINILENNVGNNDIITLIKQRKL